MAHALKIPVDTGRPYVITVEEGLLARLGDHLVSLLGTTQTKPRIALVSDHHVMDIYGPGVEKTLVAGGFEVTPITIQAGEASKSFASFERVINALLGAGLGRSDMIVALGGGVVGDLAGFCAATLKRGMRFVQVPTTLLAQVDSSVGGKTAINSAHGKNLIGAFYQPDAVFIDPKSLETLPKREVQAGFAEVVKYGLIDDAAFFQTLEEEAHRLFDADLDFLTRIIAHSCKAKARIVSADERETGQRALLNLGHTFGHAIEAVAGYDGRILHGEAVALGCIMALKASAKLGLAPRTDAPRLAKLLQSAGMRTRLSDFGIATQARDLLAAMAQDKKALNGQMTFILGPIGSAKILKDVDLSAISSVLEEEIGA